MARIFLIGLVSEKNRVPSRTMWRAAHILTFVLAIGGASRSAVGILSSGSGHPGRPSCFLDEIQHPEAGNIADATVFIAVVGRDGTLASEGTGFVVSASANVGMRGRRIVTAAHVIGDTDTHRDGERLAVFFSDGMPLGLPRTLFRGATRKISVGGYDLIENDLAVLEIASFNDDKARDRFLGLRGLPVYRGDDLLVGEAGQPFGVSWGFSGAAAIDPAGGVVGVLTGADFRDRVTRELGSVLAAIRSGGAVRRSVTLPARSLVVVEPLHVRDIWRALGLTPGLRRSELSTTLTFAGFPTASCAATSATAAPIRSQAGKALLSRWRSIGMEGAWYLPPQLGRDKILPVVNLP